MKAIYDNHAIGMYLNDMLEEYVFTFTLEDSYEIYLWI